MVRYEDGSYLLSEGGSTRVYFLAFLENLLEIHYCLVFNRLILFLHLFYWVVFYQAFGSRWTITIIVLQRVSKLIYNNRNPSGPLVCNSTQVYVSYLRRLAAFFGLLSLSHIIPIWTYTDELFSIQHQNRKWNNSSVDPSFCLWWNGGRSLYLNIF